MIEGKNIDMKKKKSDFFILTHLLLFLCSNLNGRYLGGDVVPEQEYHGIYWNDFHGQNYSLSRVKILIRPIE